VGPEGKPVDDRRRKPRVGERLAPLAEGGVGGHRDRRAFVALGQDLKQELGATAVEMQV